MLDPVLGVGPSSFSRIDDGRIYVTPEISVTHPAGGASTIRSRYNLLLNWDLQAPYVRLKVTGYSLNGGSSRTLVHRLYLGDILIIEQNQGSSTTAPFEIPIPSLFALFARNETLSIEFEETLTTGAGAITTSARYELLCTGTKIR